MTLPDLQDQPDDRGIELDEVGISGLKYPVQFDDGTTVQQAIAEFEFSVRLPPERRGTHMSRMVQLVDGHLQNLDPREFPRILKEAARVLQVESVRIAAQFPFATRVTAPVSGIASWQTHDLKLNAQFQLGLASLETTVTTDITSLCPCSKAISDYGAHNQRSRVSVVIVGTGDQPYPASVNMMTTMIRQVGSSPVYPVIKRPDERTITMGAYDRPAFVEDIARDLSITCRALGYDYRIKVINLESIHSHDAIAKVNWRY